MELLEMSFSGAVLILVIVIIRALMLHKLPKRTFLLLWGVALCRLLIPFSISSRFSIYTLANMLKMRFSEPGTAIMTPVSIGTATATINTTLIKTVSMGISHFTVVWFIGLLICALFFLVPHLRCRREYKTALPIESKFIANWGKTHSAIRKVEIRQSDKISAPLTYGIFRPVILLPTKTAWEDESQLGYILTHEFVHIHRFDTLAKLLLAITLCMHWFNPFVWVMYMLANRDIELSCDEAVVRTFGETQKSAYALTLIGLEEKRSQLTPLINNFSKNAIEERIISIMKLKKVSRLGILLALFLVLGTAIFFATSAAAAVSQDSTKPSTENEDTVLHYQAPGTPDNHSGYTDADYEALMALKTVGYRQMTTQDFLDVLQKNNIDTIYTGYNPNDKNVDFLKTLEYSCAELYAQLDAEYGQTSTTPYVSVSTASNKENSNGEYYGAELTFTVFWTGTGQLAVGERDDALNVTLEQIQEILEQKDQSQIGNTEDLNTDFQKLAEQTSNSKIKISIQIDEYKAAS